MTRCGWSTIPTDGWKVRSSKERQLLRDSNTSEIGGKAGVPMASERQVLTFRTRAWLSFAPPTCRMALGSIRASPKLIPEEGSPPGFAIA